MVWLRACLSSAPHGHTDPSWFADNAAFSNATELFLAPDHYIYRMLYSQGIDMDAVGVGSKAGPSSADARQAWHIFAANQHLFRGTPSWMWMSYVFGHIMGFDVALDTSTADFYFDRIGELLASADYRPRALFERFNIEVIATTEGPTDSWSITRRSRIRVGRVALSPPIALTRSSTPSTKISTISSSCSPT